MKSAAVKIGGAAGAGALVASLLARVVADLSAPAALLQGFLFFLLIVGFGLIWPGRPLEVKWPREVGQSLFVGVLIAIAVSWAQIEVQQSIDHSNEERTHREEAHIRRQARHEAKERQQQNLQLTLALQSHLRGIRLDGEDLRHMYLRHKDMREAKLRGAELQGTELPGTFLQGAELQKAQVEGTVFEGAHLRGAHFERAEGAGPDFDHVRANWVKMAYVTMPGAEFVEAHLANAYMVGAKLPHVFFEDADLRWVYAHGARMRKGRFEGARLADADLSKAHLEGAQLYEADLERAVLESADLRGANLRRADFRRADLTGADLTGAEFNRQTRWPRGFDPVRHGAARASG